MSLAQLSPSLFDFFWPFSHYLTLLEHKFMKGLMQRKIWLVRWDTHLNYLLFMSDCSSIRPEFGIICPYVLFFPHNAQYLGKQRLGGGEGGGEGSGGGGRGGEGGQ